MHSQLFACGPVVRCDMSARSQGTEEAVHIRAWNEIFEYFYRFRDFAAVIVELNVMQVQVKHIPVSVVSAQTSNFIRSKVFFICIRRAPIGLESNSLS